MQSPMQTPNATASHSQRDAPTGAPSARCPPPTRQNRSAWRLTPPLFPGTRCMPSRSHRREAMDDCSGRVGGGTTVAIENREHQNNRILCSYSAPQKSKEKDRGRSTSTEQAGRRGELGSCLDGDLAHGPPVARLPAALFDERGTPRWLIPRVGVWNGWVYRAAGRSRRCSYTPSTEGGLDGRRPRPAADCRLCDG
jgi:hypothetical protein